MFKLVLTKLKNLRVLIVARIYQSIKMIFVFGSNEAGRHGAGAAKTAMRYHGAEYGKGFGHYGNSFAIPTKDMNLQVTELRFTLICLSNMLLQILLFSSKLHELEQA